MPTKKQLKKRLEVEASAEEEQEDYNMAEDREDEDDESFEEEAEEDNDFIVQDDEAQLELEQQRKRERREIKRQEREQKRRKKHAAHESAEELDSDDYELIRGKKKKQGGRLKRVADPEPTEEIDTSIDRRKLKEEPRNLKIIDQRETSTAIDNLPTKDEKL